MRRPICSSSPPARRCCSPPRAPALALELTPGSISAIPSIAGVGARLRAPAERASAPEAITPIHVVVDAGAARGHAPGPGARGDRSSRRPPRSATRRRIGGRERRRTTPYVDPTGRYARVIVVGRHEYGDAGDAAARRAAARAARPGRTLPGRTSHVVVGRRAAAGRRLPRPRVRRLPVARRSRVLALTYVVLLRAFRSLAAAAQGGAAQPALGRPPSTACSSSSSSWGVGAGAARAPPRPTRSRAGSRSSSSPPCSASRWTTRCSSSRGCARRGTRRGDNDARRRARARAHRARSSPRPR